MAVDLDRIETLVARHVTDMARVTAALRFYELPEASYDVASTKVLLLADRFLEKDLETSAGLDVEVRFNDPRAHGVLDLLRLHPDGSLSLVDWKSTGSVSRPNFVEELKHSWQTDVFLGIGGAWCKSTYGVYPHYLEYRCVDDEGAIKIANVPWQPWFEIRVEQQLKAVQRAYDSLDPYYPWPRSRPHACFRGSKAGPTCQFWERCRDDRGDTVALASIKILPPPQSKSSIGLFLECAEKYRLVKLLGLPETGSSEMLLGNSVHAAIGEIYTQAYGRRTK